MYPGQRGIATLCTGIRYLPVPSCISRNIEDVPTVASEILDRHLSTNKITQIEDAVAERIDWFEAIAGAISEKIELH